MERKIWQIQGKGDLWITARYIILQQYAIQVVTGGKEQSAHIRRHYQVGRGYKVLLKTEDIERVPGR